MELFLPGLPCYRHPQLAGGGNFREAAIFVEPNFGVIEYPVRRGFGTEMVKAYLLSKDGFPYAGKAFLPAHPAR